MYSVIPIKLTKNSTFISNDRESGMNFFHLNFVPSNVTFISSIYKNRTLFFLYISCFIYDQTYRISSMLKGAQTRLFNTIPRDEEANRRPRKKTVGMFHDIRYVQFGTYRQQRWTIKCERAVQSNRKQFTLIKSKYQTRVIVLSSGMISWYTLVKLQNTICNTPSERYVKEKRKKLDVMLK